MPTLYDLTDRNPAFTRARLESESSGTYPNLNAWALHKHWCVENAKAAGVPADQAANAWANCGGSGTEDRKRKRGASWARVWRTLSTRYEAPVLGAMAWYWCNKYIPRSDDRLKDCPSCKRANGRTDRGADGRQVERTKCKDCGADLRDFPDEFTLDPKKGLWNRRSGSVYRSNTYDPVDGEGNPYEIILTELTEYISSFTESFQPWELSRVISQIRYINNTGNAALGQTFNLSDFQARDGRPIVDWLSWGYLEQARRSDNEYNELRRLIRLESEQENSNIELLEAVVLRIDEIEDERAQSTDPRELYELYQANYQRNDGNVSPELENRLHLRLGMIQANRLYWSGQTAKTEMLTKSQEDNPKDPVVRHLRDRSMSEMRQPPKGVQPYINRYVPNEDAVAVHAIRQRDVELELHKLLKQRGVARDAIMNNGKRNPRAPSMRWHEWAHTFSPEIHLQDCQMMWNALKVKDPDVWADKSSIWDLVHIVDRLLHVEGSPSKPMELALVYQPEAGESVAPTVSEKPKDFSKLRRPRANI